jgi:hypothetical protein
MNWPSIAAADADGDGFITATDPSDPNFDQVDNDPTTNKKPAAPAPTGGVKP